MTRFYVDERVGCIAVRERVNYRVSPGLHPDDSDVIAYWHGFPLYDENQKFIQWNISDWQRDKANELCELLNQVK